MDKPVSGKNCEKLHCQVSASPEKSLGIPKLVSKHWKLPLGVHET